MATKHRGKAAQAAWAAKQGEKLIRARENWNPDAATREAVADEAWVLAHAKPARLGRPVTAPEPRRSRQIMLSDSELAIARRLGNGNASAGIRAALDAMETCLYPASIAAS